MIHKYLINLIETAAETNKINILNLLEVNPQAKIVDLGCDDGAWTKEIASHIKTNKVYGLDIVKDRVNHAIKQGIKAKIGDLNQKLDFKTNSIDVVHSNQVIEHLSNTDLFLEEIYRILKPGGYTIISTENLSSWHNIVALILGFQPFSTTNYSNKGSIGNPLALWKNSQNPKSNYDSWLHQRIFSYQGLKDLLTLHGFKVEKIVTAGYYPLPGFFSNIDVRHGHWLTIKARKI